MLVATLRPLHIFLPPNVRTFPGMLRKFILETVVTIVVALLFVSTTDCWSVSGEENDEWPDPNVPPVWPDVFQVKFQEVLRVGSSDLALHNGSWYYNYPNRTARFAVFVSLCIRSYLSFCLSLVLVSWGCFCFVLLCFGVLSGGFLCCCLFVCVEGGVYVSV